MSAFTLRDLRIGQAFETGSLVISREDIVAFAASFDPQPMHLDEAAAEQTLFGRLVASGWHVAALTMRLMVQARPFGATPLIGAEIEPYTTYKGTGTLSFLEYSAAHAIALFPQLERTKVLRTWTGLCDLSPDYSPILGKTEIENLHVSAGWGTYGFKAAPIVGVTMAELVASGRTPELIAPFALERFHTDTLVSELAAAAVSH